MNNTEIYNSHPYRVSFSKVITKKGVIKSHDYSKYKFDKYYRYIQYLIIGSIGKNVNNTYSKLIHKFPNLDNIYRNYFWDFFKKSYRNPEFFINEKSIICKKYRKSHTRFKTCYTSDYKEGVYDKTNECFVSSLEHLTYEDNLSLYTRVQNYIKLYNNKFGNNAYQDDSWHYFMVLNYKIKGIILGGSYKRFLRFQKYGKPSFNEDGCLQILNKYYKGFENRVISGKVYEIDKKTIQYKKEWYEEKSRNHKRLKLKIKEKEQKLQEYFSFLKNMDKTSKQNDLIERDRLGFDAQSFKGSHYHG